LTTIESPDIYSENPLLFFREENEPTEVDDPETDASDEIDPDAEKGLVCRKCRAHITENRHVVAINGNHLHTFFNPAGIVFEIRCFSQARGCAVHGEATGEFSWFAGYVWRYALCGNCMVHLGWKYDSGENSFFGLIKDKLVET
jgi:hypothetical protein